MTSIASGQVETGGRVLLAAGTASGKTLLGGFTDALSEPFVNRGWPQSIGPDRVRDLLLLHAPLRQNQDPQDLVLVATEDQRVDLRLATGVSVPGWPKILPSPIAGSPAIGDLDADGVLEVAVTTETGDLCLYDLSGSDEPHWPRSLWHPDAGRRPSVHERAPSLGSGGRRSNRARANARGWGHHGDRHQRSPRPWVAVCNRRPLIRRADPRDGYGRHRALVCRRGGHGFADRALRYLSLSMMAA